MKPIYEFFVSNKYQKVRDYIFRGAVMAFIASGLLFIFTGIEFPAIAVAVLFVVCYIFHLICNMYSVWKDKQNKKQ